MCLTHDSDEINFCIKCPSNEVMNATVSIVFSREIVSAQYLYDVCIWVCECVSLTVLNLLIDHKCMGDFILTDRLHQSMYTRTAIKEIITATRNPQ